MKTLNESDIDQILLNFIEESARQNDEEPVKQEVVTESTEKYGLDTRDVCGNILVNEDSYQDFLKDMISNKR